jgi:hypothetical protein
MSLLGKDAVLWSKGKSGRVETTALYRRLYQAAGDIAENISIDTLSRAHRQRDRSRRVYGYINHMQALAMAGGSAPH